MSRVQLALNVPDIDEAVAFYTQLFGAPPAKRREGYANFALDDPALKLVLIENAGASERLNHLGVEVASPDEVVDATRRFSAAGLPTRLEENTACCYAYQDKVWVDAPDGAWEVYTVLTDVPEGQGHDGRVLAGVGAAAGLAASADAADATLGELPLAGASAGACGPSGCC